MSNIKLISDLAKNRLFTGLISLLLIATLLESCGVYSFTGASITPGVKTVSIQYFPNRASVAQPTLSQIFTDKLKEKFVSQTSLIQVNQSGDLRFEGYITDYNVQPTAIQSTDVAALNRLTITVHVKFENMKDEKQNFETNFSRYADFDARKDLASVESSLMNDISSQLVDDIFNKSVVNW
ncbi:MAG TPA: LptE family protein [Bacteroidia bacterium]|jgi:hypothetical protein|nr:LptE family protein [Bacteroidia bacterium]HMU18732.1 LptE family protein [Bacteroidia bacterium]